MFNKVKLTAVSRLLLPWLANMREGRALSGGGGPPKRQRTASKPPPSALGAAATAALRNGYFEPGEGTTQLGNGAVVTFRTDLLRR